MSVCEGLRHNTISHPFPTCFVVLFYSLHHRLLVSRGCVCVRNVLKNFLQLTHMPNLFGLHFRSLSLSPSHLSIPPLSVFFYPSLSFNFSLSLPADRYLGLNWLKGEKRPVKLRRQAVGGQPAYLPGLFMLQE